MFGGVKMINRVAPAFLVPVLLSIFCIFIGIFLAKTDDPDSKLFLYIVGNRRGVYFSVELLTFLLFPCFDLNRWNYGLALKKL